MQRAFADRTDAGEQLARLLESYENLSDTVVLGLPRGGVVPAVIVAKALSLPVDIVVPRKIGAPFHEELAIGAVAQDGSVVWNEDLMKRLHLKPEDVAETIEKERKESKRRVALYRHGRQPLELKNKTVILVDDGIATGATMRAAIAYVKHQGARNIVVATPVGTPDVLSRLEQEVDEVVSVQRPETFLGISAFYETFPQTSDDEVIALLGDK